ncbi:hypothetical protein EOM09_08505 [bacterium]|nr:hypothetical protein [bacterium]
MALEDKNITGEEVSQILGTSSQNQIVKFIEKLFNYDIKGLLKQISELQDQGVYLNNFNKTLLSILRNLTIYKINPEIKNNTIFSKENTKKLNKISQNNEIVQFVSAIDLFQKSLNDAKNSAIPQLPLELACIEFHLKQNFSQVKTENNPKPIAQKKSTINKAQNVNQNSTISNQLQSQKSLSESKSENSKKQTVNQNCSANPDFKKIISSWSKILETIKIQNHSIYACLKSCVPVNLKDETFYIKTNYSFHKNRLNDNKNKLTIVEIIDKITQYKIRIEFITEDQVSSLGLENSPSDNGDVFDNAIQIMGGRVID